MLAFNLNELDKLEEEDIYLLIGEEIFKEEKSFKFLTPKQTIEKAKVWFKLNLPKFQERICNNNAIKEIYEKNEIGHLTGAIIDLIAGALTGIAPATVAYLIYRQGVNLLCKKQWDNRL